MEAPSPDTSPRHTRWILAGAALAVALALGAGVFTARRFRTDASGLAVISASVGRGRLYVGVGDVVNNAGTGGGTLQGAAREGIDQALTERAEVSTGAPAAGAQRGARGVSARGHFLDASIQSVQSSGGSTRVQVSVVVSSFPGRVYEFESTSTVTLTGDTAGTPENVAAGVRRAMHTATTRAVDQMLVASR
jgi:hypothetical protein